MPEDGKPNNPNNYMYMTDQGINERNSQKFMEVQLEQVDILDNIYDTIIDEQQRKYANEKKSSESFFVPLSKDIKEFINTSNNNTKKAFQSVESYISDTTKRLDSNKIDKLDTGEKRKLDWKARDDERRHREELVSSVVNLGGIFSTSITGLTSAMTKANYNPYKMLMNKLPGKMLDFFKTSGFGPLAIKAALVGAVAKIGWEIGQKLYEKVFEGPMNEWMDAFLQKENALQGATSLHYSANKKRLDKLVELGEMSRAEADARIRKEKARVHILDVMREQGAFTDEEFYNRMSDAKKFNIERLKEEITDAGGTDPATIKNALKLWGGVVTSGRSPVEVAQDIKLKYQRLNLALSLADREEIKIKQEQKRYKENLAKKKSVEMKEHANLLWELTKSKMTVEEIRLLGKKGLEGAKNMFQYKYKELSKLSSVDQKNLAIVGAKKWISQQVDADNIVKLEERVNIASKKLAEVTDTKSAKYRIATRNYESQVKLLEDTIRERKELSKTLDKLNKLIEAGKVGTRNNVYAPNTSLTTNGIDHKKSE